MSAKDCVTTFAHAGFVSEFVSKPKGANGVHNSHEFTQADSVGHAVNLPRIVAKANDHGVPASVVTGFVRKGGKDFLIVGTECLPVDELCSHGFIQKGDVSEIGYVLKYLRKAIGQGAVVYVSKYVAKSVGVMQFSWGRSVIDQRFYSVRMDNGWSPKGASLAVVDDFGSLVAVQI